MLVAFGPQSFYSPVEVTIPSPYAPLHTGLDLGTLSVLQWPYPIDAAGQSSFAFTNPGGLEGLLAIQGILFDDTLTLVGTSTTALN